MLHYFGITKVYDKTIGKQFAIRLFTTFAQKNDR